jgi:hypothetical protein
MTVAARMDTTFKTLHGKALDYETPQPDQISLADVAHALSHTGRFLGHTSRFYSVAEHAILVSSLVMEHLRHGPEDRYLLGFAALHHDSHEAYVGDMPTPLKEVLPGFRDVAARIDEAIAERFEIRYSFEHPVIKRADAQAIRMETDGLRPDKGQDPYWDYWWDRLGVPRVYNGEFGRVTFGLLPHEAEQQFLRAHARLLRAVKPWLAG